MTMREAEIDCQGMDDDGKAGEKKSHRGGESLGRREDQLEKENKRVRDSEWARRASDREALERSQQRGVRNGRAMRDSDKADPHTRMDRREDDQ